MMKTAGYGLQLPSAISCSLIWFVGFAFVNDTDVLHVARNENQTGEHVLKEMQDVVDHWEGGLQATGGKLRADKSFWCLIDFKWTQGKWKYRSKQDLPGDITIRHWNDQRVTLTRIEPDKARETMGVFLAMDDNNKTQVQELRNKANKFASCVKSSYVTPYEAWSALHTTILKSFEYVMEATSLTDKQWNFVMAHILEATLPRAKLVRSFPRDLLYSPLRNVGIGIPNPHILQYTKQLIVFVRETLDEGIPQDLLRSNIEQLRLLIGVTEHQGDWFIPKLSTIIPPCWLKDLLTFCQDKQIEIDDPFAQIESNTSQDIPLLPSFIAYNFSEDELRKLNDCREYLRVVTLSDIVSADLQKLERWAYQGKYNKDRARLNLNWPRRPDNLGKSWWDVWKRALHLCFLYPYSNSLLIRQMLGSWNHSMFSNWIWFYCGEEERLYCKEGPFWRIWSPATRRRGRGNRRFLKSNLTMTLPSDTVYATVQQLHQCAIVTGTTTSSPKTTHRRQFDELSSQFFYNQPKDDAWAVVQLAAFNNEIEYIVASIEQGVCHQISNGSFNPKTRSSLSAFMLRGQEKMNSIARVNTVPGRPEDQDPYRAELAGISGGLSLLTWICNHFNISQGHITICCDGLQALKDVEYFYKSQYFPDPKKASYDMICDIRVKMKLLPMSLSFQWIESHQDDYTDYDLLDPLAQDNVDMDRSAKMWRSKVEETNGHLPGQRLLHEGSFIRIKGNKYANLDPTTIYAALFEDKSANYWSQKYQAQSGDYTIYRLECDRASDEIPKLQQEKEHYKICFRTHGCRHQTL